MSTLINLLEGLLPWRRLPVRWVREPTTLRHRLAACMLLTIVALGVLGLCILGSPRPFQDIWEFEDALPQHHRPAVDAKYLWFDGMLTGHGLNNVLQESLLMAYLAYAVNRSFVFQDFIWDSGHIVPYVYDFHAGGLRPSRMPLNAFISGPTAGGYLRGSEHRAVSLKFFDDACPLEQRIIISADGSPTNGAGEEILEWWKKALEEHHTARCLVVDSTRTTIFSWALLGSPRALPLYSSMRLSPILQQFAWSPLVQSAVLRNFGTLQSDVNVDYWSSENSPAVVPGLLAVHLRRGDYVRHCFRLAHANEQYTGMNQDPVLLDQFDAKSWMERSAETNTEPYYLEHCFPTIPQIVKRLRDVRADNPTLHRVYVLSNGKKRWLKALDIALREEGWTDIKGTNDLRMDKEQTFVNMAADMAIAERSEVFLGNGFSSLTANVVMLRLSKGLPSSSNRLL